MFPLNISAIFDGCGRSLGVTDNGVNNAHNISTAEIGFVLGSGADTSNNFARSGCAPPLSCHLFRG
jgi:hypothetical protein